MRRPILRAEVPGPAGRSDSERSQPDWSRSDARDQPLVAAPGEGRWIDIGVHPTVGQVRGRGLQVAVELGQHDGSPERDPAQRDQLVHGCFEHGRSFPGCGSHTARFSPALTIPEDEAHVAVEIFAEVLGRAA